MFISLFLFPTQFNDPKAIKTSVEIHIIPNCDLHEMKNSVSPHMHFLV